MKRKLLAVLLASTMVLGMLTACGGSDTTEETAPEAEEQQEVSDDAETTDDAEPADEEIAGPMTVDEAAKIITITAVATGNTKSSIHLLVNKDGGNAGAAFFTTEANTLDFYNALESLGAVPGNNISLDDETGTIEGTSLDVKITVDGTEYGAYDLITASEVREMDARFGGNIDTNQELNTGCVLCMESCPAGISSDAAYQFKEPVDFTPSDAMPEAGTEVTFTFTVNE